MGNSSKKQNQATDEEKDEKAQTPAAEIPQTENPSPVEKPAADDAGNGGNADSQPKGENAEKIAGADTKKTVRMVLKHKSHTPHYHRCSLTLTQVFAEYEVPEEAVAKIKADKWIEVKDSK